MNKGVLIYEAAPDVRERAPAHLPAHREHWAAAHERGELLMIGPFDPVTAGALGVFVSPAAAEAFARTDPFVTGGVVVRWEVREWQEVLAG